MAVTLWNVYSYNLREHILVAVTNRVFLTKEWSFSSFLFNIIFAGMDYCCCTPCYYCVFLAWFDEFPGPCRQWLYLTWQLKTVNLLQIEVEQDVEILLIAINELSLYNSRRVHLLLFSSRFVSASTNPIGIWAVDSYSVFPTLMQLSLVS